MPKVYEIVIASSALLLILQSGPVLAEAPKKKAATAKNAVTVLQNGYTSNDTSARPQGVNPSEVALVKVEAAGGPSNGTDNPGQEKKDPVAEGNPDDPSDGTDNPGEEKKDPVAEGNPDDPSDGTDNPGEEKKDPVAEGNPDDPSDGTNNPDLPPPPPPTSPS